MKIFAALFKMWKLTLPLLLLLILVVYMRFPRGDAPVGDPQPGHLVTIQNRGKVVCQADCLDLAQCGHLDDGVGGMAVMGHTGQPQLIRHNNWIPSGANVVVLENRQHRVIEITRDNEQPHLESATGEMDLSFYLVRDESSENAAFMWIAGWCIQTIP
jgi:hypothetical protein